MAFFPALFGALGAIPAFERIMNTIITAWITYQKGKTDGLITDAAKLSKQAVTSEDVEKAVQAAAEASRRL